MIHTIEQHSVQDMLPQQDIWAGEEIGIYVKRLQRVTPHDLSLASGVAHDIAQYTSGFDFVVTTGKSGIVSQIALVHSGVPKEKILWFGPEINGQIYKSTKN